MELRRFKDYFVLLAVLAVSCCRPTTGERILAVFPFQVKSHYNAYEPLLKNLAARGHEVVSISHYPQKTKLPNLIDVDVSQTLPSMITNVPVSRYHNFTLWTNLRYLMTAHGVNICEPVLRSPQVRSIIESRGKRFDMLIVEIFATDCFLAMAHSLHIRNVVGAMTGVPFPWSYDIVGSPDNPSYVPNLFSSHTDRMCIMHRVKNAALLLLSKFMYRFWSEGPSLEIARRHFGQDLPDFGVLKSKISLILTNSHFSISAPRPLSPAMKEVGGLHINASGVPPLQKDLQDYLDRHGEHGVVYFSLGSQVDTSTFSDQDFAALLGALEALPQQVLCRCDAATMPALPRNVKCIKWTPQLSVLCHPNVRLFISHGGLLGLQEAIYCGVPILGIPMFADQFSNVAYYVEKGLALQLDFRQLTQDRVSYSLNDLLKNESYRKTVKKTSDQFKDRPIPPLEEATYWIEYILRHGPDSLRTVASELSWYQHLYVDVLILFGILLYIIYRVIFLRSSNDRKRSVDESKKRK